MTNIVPPSGNLKEITLKDVTVSRLVPVSLCCYRAGNHGRLSKKSTFGTFILAIALTLTMVISAIALSNPIHVAASSVEEDNDKDNKKEKEERGAQGQGNNGAEEEEQEPNGDEEEGAQEGDPDVDQELLDELRGGDTNQRGWNR